MWWHWREKTFKKYRERKAKVIKKGMLKEEKMGFEMYG
jgi:hypothetical protein